MDSSVGVFQLPLAWILEVYQLNFFLTVIDKMEAGLCKEGVLMKKGVLEWGKNKPYKDAWRRETRSLMWKELSKMLPGQSF